MSGRSFGGGVRSLGAAVAAEAAGAADEDAGLVGEDELAAGVLGLDVERDEGALALVVDAGDDAGRGERALGGDRLLDLEGLLAVKDHHGVDLDRGGDAHQRREGGDDGEGRDHLEVALEDERQLLGADAERVEHDVALHVFEVRRGELRADDVGAECRWCCLGHDGPPLESVVRY